MNNQRFSQVIFLAKQDQLSCTECYQFLWSTVVSLTHLSSAGLITAIEELFRDAESLGIDFRHPNGKSFEIPFIFDVFPDQNEAGRRWVSNFRRADLSRTRPRYFCRCIPKLQCIDLLLQCTVSRYHRGANTPRCSFTHVPLGW